MTRSALIVDDSESACRMLEELLRRHNMQAVSVHSAEKALEYLHNHKPDVIFLDHNMPGMDGLQAVRIIKGNPATAAIPVLMYTAREGEVYLGQARALGAVDVLTKDRVRDHLEEYLAKLGMFEDNAMRDGGGADAGGEELPPRFSAASSNWEDWLQQMQSELSRQMYLILTEEQIAQREQTKRIAALVQDLVASNNDEIVRRMEGLQELHHAEKAVEARKRRWMTAGLVMAGLAFAVALYWQGQRSAAALRELHAQLQTHVTAPRSTAPAAGVPPSSPAPAARPSLQTALDEDFTPTGQRTGREVFALYDSAGAPVGRVLGVDVQAARYQALSPSGYLFTINRLGQAGTALESRYFVEANCVGEPLVEAIPGTVYRDADDQLWFTAPEGDPVDVQPLSMMGEGGECEPIDSGTRALRGLQPNDPDVTRLSVEDEPFRVIANPNPE